jgi:hypothetical protein
MADSQMLLKMTRPPNPITQGFRAVRRDPAVFLLEILWRWSFAISAIFLLVFTGMLLLGPLNLGPSFSSAMNTHDASKLGIILLSIVLRLGGKLIAAVIIIPVVIALIWSLLSAAARRITVRRLRPAQPPLGFRAMLALQLLRAFTTWIACLLLVGSIAGAIYAATQQARPDLTLFYVIAVPLVVVISIVWLICNWYLSVAAIFGQDGQSFRGAFRLARQTVRRQFSDFAGTGFVFLLLRVAVLLIVVVICGLASGMITSAPETYSALMMAVMLICFATLDFLYVSRMAAYLALAAAHAESSTAPVAHTAPQVLS